MELRDTGSSILTFTVLYSSLLSFWFLAEVLKQRLEDLEEETSSLHFQLPSRQPALRSLLVYLGAQAEAALCQAAQQ